MRVAVVTVSDRAFNGEYEDKTGPAIWDLVQAELSPDEVELSVQPDEQDQLEKQLRALCENGFDLVLTNGGTGLSPRDVTPEATMAVIERIVPGIPEAIRAAGRAHTATADLSRAVAGQCQRTLIINLPGSPKGAVESLTAILPLLAHAVSTMASGS